MPAKKETEIKVSKKSSADSVTLRLMAAEGNVKLSAIGNAIKTLCDAYAKYNAMNLNKYKENQISITTETLEDKDKKTHKATKLTILMKS